MNRSSRLAMGADAGEGSGKGTIVDRFREWRNGIVARPGFRRFAARFPLTRPIARRQTARLFDLTAGFVYSQVLAAFVRLGLVERLAAAPMSADQVARASGLSSEAADRLLRAAVALGLAERRSRGRYGLGMLGAALVGNDGVSAMIEHHAVLYGDLADPVALLRGDASPRMREFWNYGSTDGAGAERYSRLMASSQAFIAAEVLDVLPLSRVHHLLDIGGGSGAFVEAAARRYPGLDLTLLDLPQVARLAAERLGRQGVGARVKFAGGSFHHDPLPAGADMVTLVRVLHDHDDAEALALLSKIRAALPEGGILAIAEPMADTPGAAPSGDAYFGFYLLAMGQGRPRRLDEIAAMVRQAGFSQVRELPTATPLLVRVALCET